LQEHKEKIDGPGDIWPATALKSKSAVAAVPLLLSLKLAAVADMECIFLLRKHMVIHVAELHKQVKQNLIKSL
jgi:hypothetical protein